METTEKVIYKTTFGQVTDKHITLNCDTGLQNIPVKNIDSVLFRRKWNTPILWVSVTIIILMLVTLIYAMSVNPNYSVIPVIIIFCFSIFRNWLGHYEIIIREAGHIHKPLVVALAQRNEGRQLIKAIRSVL